MKAPEEEARRGARFAATLWAALGLLLVFLYLNFSLAFQNLWPTPWIRPVPELAPEVLLLFGVLAVMAARGRRLGPRGRGALALVLVLATLLRYAEVSAPPLFGRGLNLYWDSRHLPNLIELFWRSFPWHGVVLIGAAAVALLVLLWFLNRACLAVLERSFRFAWLRRAALGAALLAALGLAVSLLPGQQQIRRAFSIPAAAIAGTHIGYVIEAERLRRAGPEELDRLFGAPVSASADLAGLRGGDVLLIFLESYGATLFDTEAYARRIAAPFADFAGRLERVGWRAASRRLISPTFGGGSWMAHGTLLSGAKLSDQALYNLFLTTGRETLVDRFNAAGYRTVAVQPGTQRHWPEGEAFGFDVVYDAERLAYPGPDFGYWRIPDQFTLERFDQAELRRGGEPLFALVVLINSHMPFHPLPPYVGDWSRLEKGAAYDPEATAALVAQEPDWSGLGERYVKAMSLNFNILSDFLELKVGLDSLVILVGDHQPPALVAGKKQPWTVPIHILSQNPARLTAFLEQGYEAGLSPTAESALPMADFYRDFLEAFDGGPGGG